MQRYRRFSFIFYTRDISSGDNDDSFLLDAHPSLYGLSILRPLETYKCAVLMCPGIPLPPTACRQRGRHGRQTGFAGKKGSFADIFIPAGDAVLQYVFRAGLAFVVPSWSVSHPYLLMPFAYPS
jgi:hypothetical protein